MNVNGARFHLLLGRADWSRSADSGDAGALLLDDWWNAAVSPLPRTVPAWDETRNEVTLQPILIDLGATPGEAALTLDARRGAAADRNGNVYRIGDDRTQLRVTSAGTGQETAFWPDSSGCHDASRSAAFVVLNAPAASTPTTFLALAVSADDYLVVAFAQASQRGLISFDLVAGGPPAETLWPAAVVLEPFDMCARQGGGVWILDRANRRLWELDRRLGVVACARTESTLATAESDDFQPLSGAPRQRAAVLFPGGYDLGGGPARAIDPIAIDSTAHGSVLVLDRDDVALQSRVFCIRRQGATYTSDTSAWLALDAHDFVVGSAPRFRQDAAAPRVFIAPVAGNQAIAYDIVDSDAEFALRATAELYPLRRYGGRALLAMQGDAIYDSGLQTLRWTQIVQQPRARFEAGALFVTPVFDSAEIGTTWDKLLLDASIPADTSVVIESCSGDDLDGPSAAADSPGSPPRVLASWAREPAPALRSNGTELPWLRREAAPATRQASGTGTWELLLQRARGRYLQLRISLFSNNGTGSPRLRALRVWSPRFSYSERFLPAVYRESPPEANFLERWLANFESTLTNIEDKMVNVQALFDARTAPADTLAWLAQWFEVAMDASWDERRQRVFLRRAMDFFRWRGTAYGVRLALELAFDPCFDEAMFDGPDVAAVSTDAKSIRIVEAYQTRLIGATAAGDPANAIADGPRIVPRQAMWTPAEGNAGLADRYAASLGRAATPLEEVTPFALVPSGANSATATTTNADASWNAFFVATIGFVPSAGAAQRARWQAFLRTRYADIGRYNTAHSTSASDFASIALPVDAPTASTAAPDWSDFRTADARDATAIRWQAFLAGRYRRIERLQSAYGAAWPAFASVPLPDVLPRTAQAQADWLQFEGGLLAMVRTAHRFSVLLPMESVDADPAALEQSLGLARRMVELEKPAHTIFDVRFFWAFNRIGEARLGLDTQLGDGSRAPELVPTAVLGRAYIGASFVGGASKPKAPDRLLIEC